MAVCIYMIKGMTCLYIRDTVLTGHSIYLNRNYTINGCHLKCTSIAHIYENMHNIRYILTRMYVYIYASYIVRCCI